MTLMAGICVFGGFKNRFLSNLSKNGNDKDFSGSEFLSFKKYAL